MKVSGIYMIQSISKPERIYIGSAVDIKGRRDTHLSTLRRGAHRSIKLQNHFNKYGVEDLIFTQIEVCTKEFLIQREQYYIDTLDPWFNTAKFASSPMLHRNHSKETKDKMSEKLMGNKRGVGYVYTPSAAQIENIIRVNTGNKYWLGKHHSKETKDNLAELHKVSIIQYDMAMNFIQEWPSAKDAAKVLGLERTGISKCVSGTYNSASGFIWRRKFEKQIA